MKQKLFNLTTGKIDVVDLASTSPQALLVYIPRSQHLEFLSLAKAAQSPDDIKVAILSCTEAEIKRRESIIN